MSKTRGAYPPHLGLSQAKILIVDDQHLNRHQLSSILSKEYEVATASSGAEAVASCRQSPPDLILMDAKMPDMDGLETCKKIKTITKLTNIPILFVTAYGDLDQENACWLAGGVDFITKPVNATTLLHRVKVHMTLKLQTDILKDLAFKDMLTGLYNRRYFQETGDKLFNKSKQDQTALALLMLDIDFFKKYNDLYGHIKGDDCLSEFARLVKSSTNRQTDLCARYGGEEFVCLLPNSNLEKAVAVAEKILTTVRAANIEHKDSTFGVLSASIGIAMATEQTEKLEALVSKADDCLYQAKANGRNQYRHD